MNTRKQCDRILGCVVGLIVVFERIWIKKSIAACLEGIRDLFLDELGWFQTARPSGVKLHEFLCTFLSTIGTVYILGISKLIECLESMKAPDVSILLLGAILMVFGLNQGMRAVVCFVKAVAFPISAPAAFADVAITWHFRLLVFLWNAMRGSIHSEISLPVVGNMLKTCTSTYHIAILLFMPVVLTLPTVLWYGIFFSFWGRIARHSVSLLSIIFFETDLTRK